MPWNAGLLVVVGALVLGLPSLAEADAGCETRCRNLHGMDQSGLDLCRASCQTTELKKKVGQGVKKNARALKENAKSARSDMREGAAYGAGRTSPSAEAKQNAAARQHAIAKQQPPSRQPAITRKAAAPSRAVAPKQAPQTPSLFKKRR
ncbi:MAG: hypothetical protein HZB56_22730 [Deltaproteobacteria bacterium]|nr:hypothetical protein [Deltaproteobacteria bacterium]